MGRMDFQTQSTPTNQPHVRDVENQAFTVEHSAQQKTQCVISAVS